MKQFVILAALCVAALFASPAPADATGVAVAQRVVVGQRTVLRVNARGQVVRAQVPVFRTVVRPAAAPLALPTFRQNFVPLLRY